MLRLQAPLEIALRRAQLQDQVRRLVKDATSLDDGAWVIRQVKVGRELIIDVGVLVSAGQTLRSVTEHDEIRQQLEDTLVATGLQPWLTVHFSADRKWL